VPSTESLHPLPDGRHAYDPKTFRRVQNPPPAAYSLKPEILNPTTGSESSTGRWLSAPTAKCAKIQRENIRKQCRDTEPLPAPFARYLAKYGPLIEKVFPIFRRPISIRPDMTTPWPTSTCSIAGKRNGSKRRRARDPAEQARPG